MDYIWYVEVLINQTTFWYPLKSKKLAIENYEKEKERALKNKNYNEVIYQNENIEKAHGIFNATLGNHNEYLPISISFGKKEFAK